MQQVCVVMPDRRQDFMGAARGSFTHIIYLDEKRRKRRSSREDKRRVHVPVAAPVSCDIGAYVWGR